MLNGIHWVDLVLVAFLLLSMVFGFVSGFVIQILSLVGWLVAWVGAVVLAPQLQSYVNVGTAHSRLNYVCDFRAGVSRRAAGVGIGGQAGAPFVACHTAKRP